MLEKLRKKKSSEANDENDGNGRSNAEDAVEMVDKATAITPAARAMIPVNESQICIFSPRVDKVILRIGEVFLIFEYGVQFVNFL